MARPADGSPEQTGVAEVLKGEHTFASVTDRITGFVLTWPILPGWLFLMAVTFSLVMLLVVAVAVLFSIGVGIWGINIPVAWGFAITNFVWWIGIGHAGTLISAFLLLMRQDWRTSINRFAEAMTLFAVACAGLFPLLHLGRPQFWYWLVPYPNTMWLWPQFRSPLVWDIAAVATYFTVSLMFWYTGLIPDLASMRDRAHRRWVKLLYAVMAMGWRGSARHWKRYQSAYLIMAGLATPLVVSVHSVVSLDFTAALVPGWHSTIFPPYFVIGAIFSGFAMVLTLCIPLRRFYHLEDLITTKHLDVMAKITLVTGLLVTYSYLVEWFMAWYSGNQYELYIQVNRATGNYAFAYWILIACNVGVPHALWFKRVRNSPLLLFAVSILINVGMWTERFVIVVTSLHRDFLPSSWGTYYPTFWDGATLFGTIGLFFCLFLLFIRLLPMISIHEVRELIHRKEQPS